jgi:hypothetical protein
MTLTQCTSALVTAKDAALPAWKLTADRKLLIIGPDSAGGTIGWDVVSNVTGATSSRASARTVPRSSA